MSAALNTAAAPSATSLGDPERAAIMIMLLEEDQAALILAQLGPGELQLLGEKMCALGHIGPDQITQAISGFVGSAQQPGISERGRNAQVRSLLHKAVGEVKAESLMERILPFGDQSGPAIELARWLNPSVLIPLIKDEHPQAIAVLLVQLDPEIAAAVLHGLPAAAQSQVVHRVATLGPVSNATLTMLESLLERRIGERHGHSALALGGAKQAADIINQLGKPTEKRIMPELAKLDKALARAIENEMFKFEHLLVLDAQAMGSLLREVESELLIDALKGIEADQREVFFRAMSSRAADGVRDEIDARGRMKLADVLDAQKAIVAVAKRLAAEVVLQFGAGGGDDDYV